MKFELTNTKKQKLTKKLNTNKKNKKSTNYFIHP